MSTEPEARNGDVVKAQEEEILRKYGLRWAVLAAWRDALRLRQVKVSPEVDRDLESARMMLASGCFSVCSVGCHMDSVEGMLTSTDSSTDHNWVDFWVDLLAHSMSGGVETERILRIPAVRAQFLKCAVSGCKCPP